MCFDRVVICAVRSVTKCYFVESHRFCSVVLLHALHACRIFKESHKVTPPIHLGYYLHLWTLGTASHMWPHVLYSCFKVIKWCLSTLVGFLNCTQYFLWHQSLDTSALDHIDKQVRQCLLAGVIVCLPH